MRSMSYHSISNLPRISSTELSKILLASTSSNLDAQTPPSNVAIIDVRDDDHIGGHIKYSQHVPSHTHDYKMPELVRKLKDKETVIFHCALSEVRGPSAALKYLRERDRLLGPTGRKTTLQSGSGIGQILKQNKEDKQAPDNKDGEWEDDDEQKEQKVYVLERGFVGWQERFGEDTRLTEGYRKEIWKDGYWM